MKKEYVNPIFAMIEVSTIDTVKISDLGDGIIVDLGNFGQQ